MVQAAIRSTGPGSRRALLRLGATRDHRLPLRRARFNAATPFFTPDPPWLSNVPVVFAIMMLPTAMPIRSPTSRDHDATNIRVQLPTSCPDAALFRCVALGFMPSGP
jgi:hypothetical protein